MAQEKAPKGVKFQFLIFGVLLLILFIWANRKCTRSQSGFEEDREVEQRVQARVDSLSDLADARNNPPTPARTAAPTRPQVNADTIRGGQLQIIREKTTPLYITIDNLAMRKGPGLNYEIVDRLPLYTEVNFLNEVTDSIYTIKLGSITPSEPWVKIRNVKGREGWVYGAGVDYYKHKLEGVE